MKHKIIYPGFTALDSISESSSYQVNDNIGVLSAINNIIQPQYRTHVSRHCGPCTNGKRMCVLYGYECTVIPGVPGSDHLGVPGSPGHVQCQPEIFREWEISC